MYFYKNSNKKFTNVFNFLFISFKKLAGNNEGKNVKFTEP